MPSATEAMPPALKRFQFLAAKMSSVGDVSSTTCAQLAVAPMSTTELIKTQLAQLRNRNSAMPNVTVSVVIYWYRGAVSSGSVFSGGIGESESLRFWKQNNNMRSSKLVMIAQDLISAPASQTFVERMYSLCGILTAARLSSMRKSVEMRVFLKLNQQVLRHTGFHL